jgi:riboflavin biosynthesis pyrimidine reductase
VFIIDLKLKLKKRLSLNKYLKKRKIYLVTSKININESLKYKKLGYKIILVNQLKNKNDFILLYKKIYKLGYSRMLIESGLTFLNNLLKNRTIHELYIFKSKKTLGKNGKNNSTTKFIKKIYPDLLTINLNGDNLFKKSFNYV